MPVTLYLDEHFGSGDAAELVRRGAAMGLGVELFSVHQHHALDPDQLAFAARRGWLILTRDRDFLEIDKLWHAFQSWRSGRRRRHAGILLVLGPVVNADVVIQVVSLVSTVPEADLADRLFVLERHGSALRWTERRPFR